jgi:chemotaxis protein CheD
VGYVEDLPGESQLAETMQGSQTGKLGQDKTESTKEPAPKKSEEVLVGLADVVVRTGSVQFAFVGLGSCIGVVALDPKTDVSGAVHIMLPHSISGMLVDKLGKFADTGVEELLRQMIEAGAQKDRICVAFAGGASVGTHDKPAYDIGARNLEALKETLSAMSLPVVAADAGGTTGRTVRMFSSTGEVIVRTIKRGEAVLCSLRAA